MQTRDFCFWLQGLLEVGKIETLDADQVALIKAHLDLVFKHDASIKRAEMEHPIPIARPSGPLHPIGSQQDWRTQAPYNPSLITATC